MSAAVALCGASGGGRGPDVPPAAILHLARAWAEAQPMRVCTVRLGGRIRLVQGRQVPGRVGPDWILSRFPRLALRYGAAAVASAVNEQVLAEALEVLS